MKYEIYIHCKCTCVCNIDVIPIPQISYISHHFIFFAHKINVAHGTKRVSSKVEIGRFFLNTKRNPDRELRIWSQNFDNFTSL